MRDDLRQLLHLQSLGNRITECGNEKAARIRELELLDEKLARAISEAEKEKELCNKGQVTLKELELAAGEKRSKIQTLREKSSMIRNNRDYQAAMQEISGFEADIRMIEDRELEAMELIDEEKAALARIEKQIEEARQTLEKEKIEAKREMDELDAEVIRLQNDRETAAQGVEESLREVFEHIYQGRKGRAVVPVVDKACQGCYMQLSPQQANDVLKDDKIYYCENCGRILYLKEEQPGLE